MPQHRLTDQEHIELNDLIGRAHDADETARLHLVGELVGYWEQIPYQRARFMLERRTVRQDALVQLLKDTHV